MRENGGVKNERPMAWGMGRGMSPTTPQAVAEGLPALGCTYQTPVSWRKMAWSVMPSPL